MPTTEDEPNLSMLSEPEIDATPTNEAVGNVVCGTAVIFATLKRLPLPTTWIEALDDTEPTAVIPDDATVTLRPVPRTVPTPINVDEG
jgi:hypothetical protein